MINSKGLQQLQGQQYINLTTYRKSGEGVPTPVWFALEGDRLYIVTQQDSGKVKRIRNNPRVTLAPSDAQGKVKPGVASIEGTAVVQSAEEGVLAHQALKGKYGWMYSAFALLWRVQRNVPVYLAVTLASG
jgi:hypothetical protein